MRVMVTGAAGLLGTWLRRTAPPGVQLVLAVRATPLADLGEQVAPTQVQADLTDPEAVDRAVAEAACDLVLHAAYRIDDEASVTAVTDNIVAATARHGADLVMMSSDAVFAGDGRRRTETDRPDPVSDYGRWKAEAERRARSGVSNSTVVRVPLLCSFDPPSLMVEDVRAAVRDGRTVAWKRGETRKPVWASEVAGAVWRIIALDAAARAGVWHLSGPVALTRAEVGRWVAARLGVDDPGVEEDPPSSNWPRDLRLDDGRARQDIGWDPTPITDPDGDPDPRGRLPQ